MKFKLIATLLLVAALGAAFLVFEDGNAASTESTASTPVQQPQSADDAALKALKIP